MKCVNICWNKLFLLGLSKSKTEKQLYAQLKKNSNQINSHLYPRYTNYKFIYSTFLDYEVSVQAEIEKPQIYLLARCPSGEEQMMYSETRLEDIKELSQDLLFNNVPITDEVRFFKGKFNYQFFYLFMAFRVTNKND